MPRASQRGETPGEPMPCLDPPWPEHEEDDGRRAAALGHQLGFHVARVDVAAAGVADVHDPAEARAALCALLSVSEALDRDQREIVEDFYFYLYAHAKGKGWEPSKIATLLSICREVFDSDMSTNDPAKDMNSSFDRLERLLLKHAVFRPPKSVGVFDEDDASAPERERMGPGVFKRTTPAVQRCKRRLGRLSWRVRSRRLAAATGRDARVFRGGGVAAPPRLPRGYSEGTRRRVANVRARRSKASWTGCSTTTTATGSSTRSASRGGSA